MTFRTITAKYPGTCKRCQSAIYIGDRIRYAGPGRTWHLAADCHGAAESTIAPVADTADDSDAPAVPPPAPRVNIIRRSARRTSRGYIGRDYYDRDTDDRAGREFLQNPRGRCEDAPCCGCCS